MDRNEIKQALKKLENRKEELETWLDEINQAIADLLVFLENIKPPSPACPSANRRDHFREQ